MNEINIQTTSCPVSSYSWAIHIFHRAALAVWSSCSRCHQPQFLGCGHTVARPHYHLALALSSQSGSVGMWRPETKPAHAEGKKTRKGGLGICMRLHASLPHLSIFSLSPHHLLPAPRYTDPDVISFRNRLKIALFSAVLYIREGKKWQKGTGFTKMCSTDRRQ